VCLNNRQQRGSEQRHLVNSCGLGSEQRHLYLGTPVQEDFGEDTHKHRDTMDEILDAQEFWEDI